MHANANMPCLMDMTQEHCIDEKYATKYNTQNELTYMFDIKEHSGGEV